jgi:hypothetical protein
MNTEVKTVQITVLLLVPVKNQNVLTVGIVPKLNSKLKKSWLTITPMDLG